VDFVGRRHWFFIISALVLVPGMVFLAIAPGLKQGIDFTGGSSLAVRFASVVDEVDIRTVLNDNGHPDAKVQGDQNSDTTFFIQTRELQEEQKNEVVDALAVLTPGAEVELLSFDLVSAAFAREILVNALWAVLAAAVGIFFFLWWAFRSVPNPMRYGAAALVALLHDTLIVVGLFAMLGVLFDVEVNTMFFIAFLLVYGYSVNDTIVIFDRLRENAINYPTRSLEDNVNVSISESIGRSLNTSLTLMFTLLALLLFGGPTIREFLWVLLIGVVVGTYSSIGIASSVLVAWEAGDFGRLLGRGRRSAGASGPA
jgi:preprotein translocase subunit SecF